MIFERRDYWFAPGDVPKFLEIYETMALPLQLKHFKTMVGYWKFEEGEEHRTMGIWAYDSKEARLAARASIEQEPTWEAYKVTAGKIIKRREITLMEAAPYYKFG